MKLLKALAVLALFASVTATPVLAKSVNRTVPAGKTSMIFLFYVLDGNTCQSSNYAKVTLRKPKNGRLTSKNIKFKPSAGERCAGKQVKGVAVYYTPKRGFRGVDKGRFGFNMARFTDGDGYKYYGVRATINVK